MFKILFFVVTLISFGDCYKWVPWNSRSYNLPSGAYAGQSSYYVIRARHSGGLLPGHYDENENNAFVSYNGYEIPYQNFEVSFLIFHYNFFKYIFSIKILTSPGGELIWENAKTGRRLVVGGNSGSGDTLYICRFSKNGRLVPGKLHNGKCYISLGGQEYSSGNWETLKLRYG